MFLKSVGILSGGYLSDRFGERYILIIFNVLSFVIYAFLMFAEGIWVIVGIVLLGYTLTATSTANITITHNLLPEDINLGTGMVMGLPGTIGGFLILVFVKLSDIYGLMEMAQITACLGLIPVFISLYISKKYDNVSKPILVK